MKNTIIRTIKGKKHNLAYYMILSPNIECKILNLSLKLNLKHCF